MAVNKGKQASRLLDTLKAIPVGVDISEVMANKDELSEYFLSYIQQVKNYPQKYVKNRTCFQRLSGLPPANIN
jgi:hypothetical protein